MSFADDCDDAPFERYLPEAEREWLERERREAADRDTRRAMEPEPERRP